jgi:23S rRNA (cytidine1920-2'-O)/16S rRNA (cytidine1409-2'-O)-methyltransferase
MTRKRADILLVETGLFDTRAKARAAIEAGAHHRRRQGR